jgi:segregation and condensation protein A
MVQSSFRVDLTQYTGPMDLLLYLVKRDEVDLAKISLSKILHQFLEFIEILSELDLDGVAEFLDVASILIEMKSLLVLPGDETVETIETPNTDTASDQLVYRLYQYKRFRQVANLLDERSLEWQTRYKRLGSDLPSRKNDLSEQPLADLQIWDLVSAFGRILKANQPLPTTEVIYDDTPIHVHMNDLHGMVKKHGRVDLQGLFQPGFHKSKMVAMFLATLELTRHHGVDAMQDDLTDAIWLSQGTAFTVQLDAKQVDNVSNDAFENTPLEFRAR